MGNFKSSNFQAKRGRAPRPLVLLVPLPEIGIQSSFLHIAARCAHILYRFSLTNHAIIPASHEAAHSGTLHHLFRTLRTFHPSIYIHSDTPFHIYHMQGGGKKCFPMPILFSGGFGQGLVFRGCRLLSLGPEGMYPSQIALQGTNNFWIQGMIFYHIGKDTDSLPIG